MKVVCYTALIGDYDELADPEYISDDWDYVVFTDQPVSSDVWEVRPLVFEMPCDPTRTNRWHKINAHLLFPHHEISIYLDANVVITGHHLQDFVSEFVLGSSILAIPPHPYRNCIYDEARACIRERRDSTLRILAMVRLLRKSRYPTEKGLFENNLMIRRHCESVMMSIQEDWWSLVLEKSKRDQLSLMYLLWKNKIGTELIVPPGSTIRDYPGYRYDLHPHQMADEEEVGGRISGKIRKLSTKLRMVLFYAVTMIN